MIKAITGINDSAGVSRPPHHHQRDSPESAGKTPPWIFSRLIAGAHFLQQGTYFAHPAEKK
jgi:hypothetical protein